MTVLRFEDCHSDLLMLRRQGTFTTENTEFTEILKRIFSVFHLHLHAGASVSALCGELRKVNDSYENFHASTPVFEVDGDLVPLIPVAAMWDSTNSTPCAP